MNVIVQVATTPQALPSGITAGALRFQLVDAQGTVTATQDVNEASATFSNVADGTYVATVQRLDANGAGLGGAISQSITVVTPAPATFDAPTSITVTVQ